MSASSSPAYEACALLRRSFERFASVPDAAWDDIQRPWQLHEVRRVTHQGDVERRFSIIIEGVQRLYFTTPDGGEHTAAFAYAPDVSGVPDSFFFQTPSACGLDALSDGRVLAIDHARLAALMEAHRELERWA